MNATCTARVYDDRVRFFLLLLAGCAAPFVEVKPHPVAAGGVNVTFCGSADVSPDTVMKTMEPPSSLPSEVGGGGGLEPPKDLRVCLRVENRGRAPARLDRGAVTLKCPREKQPWVPDSDDQEVIVHAGESREAHVFFHYSPLVAGEDVAVILDAALKVGEARARLPPIVLRKK
jgi:hypothetical protein